jgi:hypothetical protein
LVSWLQDKALERSLLPHVEIAMATEASPRVVVVGENPETVDGLQAYFVAVGISAHSARTLEATLSIPDRTTAVVVFPDGFRAADVVERITALRGRRPGLLLLVVTGEPQRFAAALKGDASSTSCLILPKPAFGWTIVDAIRLHADSSLA